MEAIFIIDILRRAKADVVVASVEDKLEILASRKVKLVADVLLDQASGQSYDLIVLPVSVTNHFSSLTWKAHQLAFDLLDIKCACRVDFLVLKPSPNHKN